MNSKELQRIIDSMDPEEALAALAAAVRRLFPVMDEEARRAFMVNLVGAAGGDKVSSMVHLWLATCLGEGVDPTTMCQSLVDKVSRSRQLMAATDPELLVLFEDWLEELEDEIVSQMKENQGLEPAALAQKLALPASGVLFLLNKLRREGRLP